MTKTKILLFLTAFVFTSLGWPVAQAEGGSLVFQADFNITAYYSPQADQQHYFRGDFDADRLLNGNGTNGADGTAVYFGMLAAGKGYPFGTQIYVPGLGLGAVHDRGGAIRDDRLDVWMGGGEIGLARALSWGRRNLTCTVYLPGADVPASIASQNFANGYLAQNASLAVLKGYEKRHIDYVATVTEGASGPEVEQLQKDLKQLGYFDEEVSGYYGTKTAEAVYAFQLDSGVVTSRFSYGAGFFGPRTKKSLEKAAKDGFTAPQPPKNQLLAQKPESAISTQPTVSVQPEQPKKPEQDMIKLASDPEPVVLAVRAKEEPKVSLAAGMKEGMFGTDVKELQKVLIDLGYLAPEGGTGYFGSWTTKAIYQLQKEHGIVSDENALGAGLFGPKTKEKLEEILMSKLFVQEEIVLAEESA